MDECMTTRDDDGVASVLLVALLAVLLVAGMCGAAVAGLALGRQHADQAADQAALAAASTGDCDQAVRVAQANLARLRDCRWVGADVVVVVEASLPAAVAFLGSLPHGHPSVILSSARAGPPQ
jgi:secretion/DNA translocation related TadE-like protein